MHRHEYLCLKGEIESCFFTDEFGRKYIIGNYFSPKQKVFVLIKPFTENTWWLIRRLRIVEDSTRCAK